MIAAALAAALLPGLWLRRIAPASLTRAHDAWLVGLTALGIAAYGWHEPWWGVPAAYLWAWWLMPAAQDPLGRAGWQKLPTLLTWAGVGGTWVLARELPAWAWAWLPTVWGVWAWGASAAVFYQWRTGDPLKIRAWHGQRSIVSAFLVLVMALIPLWAWPGPLVGLWLTGPSWGAVGALAVSSLVRWPDLVSWWLLAPVAGCATLIGGRSLRVGGRAILEWTPRGDSLDSLWHRVALLRLAWQDASWRGAGPGTTPPRHRQAAARGTLREATGTVHCEPAQVVSEYGLAGAVALGLFVWRVAPGLTLGDPWSAMVVSGAVLACGTMALRVAPIGLLWLLACAEVSHGPL